MRARIAAKIAGIRAKQHEPEPLPVRATEKHYTADQIAEMWNISETTARRIFRDMPGVLKLSVTSRGGEREYVTLRVPESVLQRVHQENAR